MTSVLMVCMGNICRSPMAEAVARHISQTSGLSDRLSFASAGTHSERHAGELPDPRARQVLARRGYPETSSRSRSLVPQDFQRFDLILAMDRKNLATLSRMALPQEAHKVRLFLDFAENLEIKEIPDPYYGQMQGFERVLDLCEAGSHGLIKALRKLDYAR